MDAIKLMYCDLRAHISEDQYFTLDDILIALGLKQGCPASPILFSLFFDRVETYI